MSRLTVVIPTHNRPAMMQEAYGSAKNQAEIAIINSGDHTSVHASLAKKVVSYNYIPERDEGPSVLSWLVGVAAARTEYVTILYDDDALEPEFAERMMALIDETRADVAFCNGTICRPDGTTQTNLQIEAPRGVVFRDQMIDAIASMQFTVTPACCVFRRETVLDHLHPGRIGRMPRGLAGPDKLLLLLALHDARVVAWEPASLVQLRAHAGSCTCSTPEDVLTERYRVAVETYRLLTRGRI